jgi:hypothetical protein
VEGEMKIKIKIGLKKRCKAMDRAVLDLYTDYLISSLEGSNHNRTIRVTRWRNSHN